MTTTTTTTTTKTRFINGANELKRTIQEYVDMTHEMKMRFEHDIESPLAKIDPSPICRPLHDFNARQCAVTHRDFIRKVALESDELSGPATNMNATLDTLEKLRKMLVTNKQQRKTAHKHFRRIANSIQASFQSNTMLVEMELEPEPVSLTIDLMNMDANAKQHHRTIARNILEEVNRLLAQMRQFIVALQVAFEDAVGKIIQHAAKDACCCANVDAFEPEQQQQQQQHWTEAFNIADGRAAAAAIMAMVDIDDDGDDDDDDNMCWE